MENEHISDLIPGYALDCLDEAEFAQADAHLSTCPVCRAELAAYQATVDQLAVASPDIECSSDLKARLMARVQSPSSVKTAMHRSWWTRLRGLFQRTAPVWGLASAALAIVLLISNVILLQQVQPPGAMSTILLSGTEARPEAVGMIVVGVHGDEGGLVVDNLASLDAAHQYQLWLIKGEERTNGGVFSVDENGYAVLWVECGEPLDSFERFGITIEPAGGSPGPTGESVLGGSL